MSRRPDIQTVTAAGRAIAELPHGVVTRDLVTHPDERGTLFELYDPRWGVHESPLVYAYVCTIRPGWAKGWAVHQRHDDRYALVGGEAELVLYDERPDSPTEGLEARLLLTEHHRRVVTIPAGVWHAERNLGPGDVTIVNFPTEPYDHEHPDKERLPLDTRELPVVLGPEWKGW